MSIYQSYIEDTKKEKIRIDSRIDLDTQTLRYQNYNNKERDKDGKGQRVRDTIRMTMI